MSDGPATDSAPPATKERLLESIGDAFDVTSITQIEQPDGSRQVELRGTFEAPEPFFLSKYCREQLKLTIAPAGEGKAVIQCNMELSSNAPVSLEQFYGLAKGLRISRTIHLPAAVEQTNGIYTPDTQAVRWTMDLRNQDGLARTKAFAEGADEGRGIAVFDASALSFALPLHVPVVPEETRRRDPNATRLAAEVAWVSVQRTTVLNGQETSGQSYTEVGVELTREEATESIRYEQPVWVSLFDSTGENLIDEAVSGFSGTIREGQKRALLRLKAKIPSPGAKELRDLRGYIEVAEEVVTETVTLENIATFAGQGTTGNAILDKLHFKVRGVRGDRLDITIDGGRSTIQSIALFKDDGTEIATSGSMGGGDQYTYNFRESIPPSATCRLTVIVSETMVKVPFHLDRIKVP